MTPLTASEKQSLVALVKGGAPLAEHWKDLLFPSGAHARAAGKRASRESAERYRLVVETAQEGIGMLNAEAAVVFLNARMAEMFGYATDEVLGRPIFDFIHPEDHAAARSRLKQIEAGAASTFDFRFRKRDGANLWLICSCTPTRDVDGRYNGVLGMLTDITERRRIETALRERERELNEAQRVAGIGSFLWDATTDTTHWTEELYRITGHDRRLPPPSFEEHARFYAPKDWDRLVKLATSRTPLDPTYVMDTELLTDRCEIKWISIRSEAEFGPDGRMLQLRGTVQDITDRKRIETELSEAQRVARVGSWDYDTATGTTRWSGEMYRIYGRDPNLPPPTMDERSRIYSRATWKQLESPLRDATRAGKPFQMDLQVLQRGKPAKWVHARCEPVYDRKGKVLRLRGTAQDVTERKQGEIVLRRNEQTLAEAQRLAQLGSWSLNLKTGTASWSQELRRITGLPHGQPPPPFEEQRSLMSEMSWKRLNAAIEATRNTGRPFELEMALSCYDGREAWVMFRGEAEPALKGKIHSLRGTVQDITERKQLKEQILQAADHEQGRIARDLHDGLCQKLTGLRFMCDALSRELRTESPPNSRAFDRLSIILDSSLKEARGVARGLHPVKPEANGLMSALTEFAMTMNSIFRVECRFRAARTVLVHDHSVATHLFRIVQEATSNAIRHGKARRVTIRLAALAKGALHLTMNADGKRLPISPRSKRGLGLEIMRYRASLIGAFLQIKPGRHGGTRLSCMCPIPAPPRRRKTP